MKQIDRRISVAPMMDWTDDRLIVFWISSLASAEMACLLYVSSWDNSDRVRSTSQSTPPRHENILSSLAPDEVRTMLACSLKR